MKSGKSRTATHVWLLLSKARRALELHAQRSIASLGICLSDFAVLEALLHKGPLPVSVIGKKVLLTSGSMTAAVDRLEQHGLVERKADNQDRRTRIVHLTERGRTLIQRLFLDHERHMEHAMSVLSKSELSSLAAALRKLGRGAERLAEEFPAFAARDNTALKKTSKNRR